MNKINFLASVALASLLIACKDENEVVEPENKVPSGSIIVNSETETLWNEVMITVDASDPDGTIASVELYADDAWVGSDSEAPYEFAWNTKDVGDGMVELKAVIKDEMDATVEPTKTVAVLNTLIDYDLHVGYLDMNPNLKFFTYITSKSKEVLHYEQIEELPYKTKVMRPDNFNDEHFDIHFAYANPTVGSLITYTDLTAGTFAPVNPNKNGEKIGLSKMQFTDIPEHDYFTYGNYKGHPLKIETNYSATIYENLSLGYLYLRNGDKGLYSIIEGLKDGEEETSLSITGFEMQQREITIKEKIKAFNTYVYGHIGPEADAPFVKLFSHSKDGEMENYDVMFHTPDKSAVFDHYSSYLYLGIGEKGYMNESYFGVITTMDKMKFDVQINSHQLSDVDFTVNADPYDALISKYYTTHDGFNFFWTCYSENEDIEFPIIPAKLTQAFPKFNNSNLVFKEADINLSIEDYDHLKGYKDYLAIKNGRAGKTVKDGATKYKLANENFYP